MARNPLLGVWGLSYDRARTAGERVERPIVSLVGAPMGLTGEGAQPLANNFAHALLRIDIDSRALAGRCATAAFRRDWHATPAFDTRPATHCPRAASWSPPAYTG